VTFTAGIEVKPFSMVSGFAVLVDWCAVLANGGCEARREANWLS
jgi:hypothetical protein